MCRHVVPAKAEFGVVDKDNRDFGVRRGENENAIGLKCHAFTARRTYPQVACALTPIR